jgi:hypothetical protein
MARWIYNVDAVVKAAHAANSQQEMPTPIWWTRRSSIQNFRVGEFIGQGRRVQYCGLTFATIRAARKRETPLADKLAEYEDCAAEVMDILSERRPASWYATALLSLVLVWTSIIVSFLVAFVTPTYGLGCWGGITLLYGILSTFTRIYHFLQASPGPTGRALCHIFNTSALLCIIFTTTLVVSTVHTSLHDTKP